MFVEAPVDTKKAYKEVGKKAFFLGSYFAVLRAIPFFLSVYQNRKA